MNTSTKNQQNCDHLPSIRTNRHFRIKSASKEKLALGGQILTTKSIRKRSIDQNKRIFSEPKPQKIIIGETRLKIKITRDELQNKLGRKEKKRIFYEGIKTQQEKQTEIFHNLHTIQHEENIRTLQKIVKMCDPTRIMSHSKLQQISKNSTQPNKFKKEKTQQKLQPKRRQTTEEKPHNRQKEVKGKIRCRVNQYVFDHHTRRKSHLVDKDQQDAIDKFWLNVNESMILTDRQTQEMSTDLREFVVQNFTTE